VGAPRGRVHSVPRGPSGSTRSRSSEPGSTTARRVPSGLQAMAGIDCQSIAKSRSTVTLGASATAWASAIRSGRLSSSPSGTVTHWALRRSQTRTWPSFPPDASSLSFGLQERVETAGASRSLSLTG
jgi:hypothetical protein